MTIRSITPHQQKQFKRFVDDATDKALKEINPDKDGLQRLLERGGEFQTHVLAGIRRFTAKTPDYSLARTILGKDFIAPEEIAKSRKPIVYTDEQLAQFGDSVPAQEVLEWCRDNGYMLVAGPNRPMSLLNVRAVKKDHFYSKDGGLVRGAGIRPERQGRDPVAHAPQRAGPRVHLEELERTAGASLRRGDGAQRRRGRLVSHFVQGGQERLSAAGHLRPHVESGLGR